MLIHENCGSFLVIKNWAFVYTDMIKYSLISVPSHKNIEINQSFPSYFMVSAAQNQYVGLIFSCSCLQGFTVSLIFSHRLVILNLRLFCF